MNRWKKIFVIFVLVALLLCIFLPMRSSYDNYFFQLDEEKEACNFLAYNIQTDRYNHVGVSQISGDYFGKKTRYYHYRDQEYRGPLMSRPHSNLFYNVFNVSMEGFEYLIFNPNVGKHISSYGFEFDAIETLMNANRDYNNKIYESGKTYIMTGS